MAWSTQATVEAKARAARVRLWTDKDADGIPDTATLDQGFLYAQTLIVAHITQRYGSQVDDWTLETVPDFLKPISDSLALYYFASGSNAINPVVQLWYDHAIDMLSQIRDGLLDIPGVSDSGVYDTVTALLEDPFDDEDDDTVTAYTNLTL